ncbi:mechanosensitive ion channel family protein [Synoicihabitans lomoniglobus]|uniref:Mechanosensitive ion channel n=1 Tax=Synoicihabitans lomoniglobus TaxID=2909285 RepID=A0AAF0CPY1_9BACT|nr:mechanosensitive ion channel [Opitutaceae bacterium LMO-M01]WED65882.1 mechanosensitive ion channel [Opitutaceae bacterium LMO-M01]
MDETTPSLLAQIIELLRHPLFDLGDTPITALGILKLLILITLVIFAEAVLRRIFLTRVLSRTHLDEGMRFAIARISGYIFLTLGFYLALNFVGIDLSSLAVFAGAIGVGLGFGLQNIVHNFISGIIILAERPIAIGDRVEVNGVAGKVAKISLRSTIVVTNDNISVIVPNSNFISEPVVNWSHGDPKVRINVPVGIAYGSDVPKFRRLMTEVALSQSEVLRDPAPNIFFIGFGDSSLDFEIGVWTAEMLQNPKRFRSELYYKIEAVLRENGIEIPFPQRDLHVRSGTLPVRRVDEASSRDS